MIIQVVQIVEGRPKRHFRVTFSLCISAVTVGQNIARSVVEAVAHLAALRNRVKLGRFMHGSFQSMNMKTFGEQEEEKSCAKP